MQQPSHLSCRATILSGFECRLLQERLEVEQAAAAEAAGARRALEAQAAALEAAAAALASSQSDAASVGDEAVAQSLRETVAQLEKQLHAMQQASAGR